MSTRLRLGIAGDLVPTDPDALTAEHTAWLASLGIRSLVTHFRADPQDLTGERARRVAGTLADAGIRIAQAAGYNPNLVQSDDARRDADLARLRAGFASARDMDAEVLLTGCGSLHPSLFYGPDRRNHTAATRERLIENLRLIAPIAAEHEVQLGLECHLQTTLDTAENIREIMDAVDSAWIKVNFDPVNLIGELQSAYDSGNTMRNMHRILGGYLLPMAHIKDVVVDTSPVLTLREGAPGEGELDIRAFFEICQQFGDGGVVIVEHLPREKSLAAIAWAREAGIEAGIKWVC